MHYHIHSYTIHYKSYLMNLGPMKLFYKFLVQNYDYLCYHDDFVGNSC